MKRNETPNKRIAAVVTISTHVLVALIFILIPAWTAPDPAIPEFGMAVNFGTDDAGFGEQQNYNRANDNDQLEDARPNDNPREEVTSEKTPQPERVEEQGKEMTTEDQESPEVAKNQPAEKPQEVKKENKGEDTPKKTSEGTPDSKGTGDKNAANNNGNQPGKVGDQGDKSGDVNSDALLGKGSGMGGASLDMAGWRWDQKPVVNDVSDETGKIVFEITIDDSGEIINVVQTYRTVSRSVASVYERAVSDLTFSPTPGSRPGTTTKGKITFIITSR